jgi:hypothetical protein
MSTTADPFLFSPSGHTRQDLTTKRRNSNTGYNWTDRTTGTIKKGERDILM